MKHLVVLACFGCACGSALPQSSPQTVHLVFHEALLVAASDVAKLEIFVIDGVDGDGADVTCATLDEQGPAERDDVTVFYSQLVGSAERLRVGSLPLDRRFVIYAEAYADEAALVRIGTACRDDIQLRAGTFVRIDLAFAESE